ncbi:UNVERIFIED_CONTAM: hypothetical protein FKN15_038326 [Acipenser sinensis]
MSASQQDLKLEELKLIQEVDTRWNSTFLMLERFLRLKEPVSAALTSLGAGSLPVIFHKEQTTKPFFAVTEEMSAEKYVTASKVIVLVSNLQKNTATAAQQHDKGITAHSLADVLNKCLWKRCGTYESARFLEISTVLDPRFKTLVFGNDKNADEAIKTMTPEA